MIISKNVSNNNCLSFGFIQLLSRPKFVQNKNPLKFSHTHNKTAVRGYYNPIQSRWNQNKVPYPLQDFYTLHEAPCIWPALP